MQQLAHSCFPEFQASLHRISCLSRTFAPIGAVPSSRSFHKLSRVPRRAQVNNKLAAMTSRTVPPQSPSEYSRWTQQQLISRIQDLEIQLQQQEATLTTNPTAPNPAICTSAPIPSVAEERALPQLQATIEDESGQGGGKIQEQKLPYRKPPKQPPKAFDASKYSTRLIALKFAYLGQGYNGFEHHKNNRTPLPTIEEELWKALVKTRLITPVPTGSAEQTGEPPCDRMGKTLFEKWDREGAEANWDGCDYSKCGRTDRGVSAFGQVIGIRVRSNKPLSKVEESPSAHHASVQEDSTGTVPSGDVENEPEIRNQTFDDLKDELPYIQLLNRVLPPTIRIYAWCPNPPPDFSARFSCKERRYKYFFTNPCFAPVPGSSSLYDSVGGKSMREGWLDIESMRAGCRELVGLHDFRNFCKIDASKQLTNFKRRIFHASIDEVSPLSLPTFLSHPSLSTPHASTAPPKLYAFTLHGSAFLWHQVRSLVAILFLIGQGLESPSLIPALLDVSANPTRPKYEMASDAPLVLWDCVFPAADEVQSSEEREVGYEDRLEWVYVGDEGGVEPKGKSGGGGIGRGKWGRGGLIDDVWEVWRRSKIDETLSSLLLDTVAAQGKSKLGDEANAEVAAGPIKARPRVFDGADVGRAKGNYVPVLQRERQEPVEVVNERYARKKGLDPEQRRPREEDADD